MSNAVTSHVIDYGHQVIVYTRRSQMQAIWVTRGDTVQSPYGYYKHDEMVGVKYGQKFPSSNGRGFVYLLKPTPELWTLALPHRTQILYLPDIAFITSYLDIKAGSTVIEAGTGSGSFTHAIARSVGANGKIHSFEFNKERYIAAEDEFQKHGLNKTVELKLANVCKTGFELKDEVDSVFLDLPAPWEALGSAKVALRKDRQSRICCFSPCVEQVIRTVTALSEHGFSDITMYETLTRDHEPTTTFLPTVANAIERLQSVEVHKERRRNTQLAQAQKRRDAKELKRKRDDVETEGDGELGDAVKGASEAIHSPTPAASTPAVVDNDGPSLEKVKPSTSLDSASLSNRPTISDDSNSQGTSPSVAPPAKKGPASKHPNPNANDALPRVNTFRAGAQTRGHTSYLTFATLLPFEEDKDKAESVVANDKVAQAEEEDEYPMEEDEMNALLALDESQHVPASTGTSQQ